MHRKYEVESLAVDPSDGPFVYIDRTLLQQTVADAHARSRISTTEEMNQLVNIAPTPHSDMIPCVCVCVCVCVW